MSEAAIEFGQLKEINTTLGSAFEFLWPEILLVVWISLVTMAILQLVKDLTPFRRRFQRKYFKDWFDDRNPPKDVTPYRRWLHIIPLKKWFDLKTKEDSNSKTKTLFEELIELAAPRGDKFLFALPIEQFVGQINTAAHVVFEQREIPLHLKLLKVFANRIDSEEIEDLKSESEMESKKIEIEMESDNLLSEMKRKKIELETLEREQLNLKMRINHQIQRNMDIMMILIGKKWRFRLRLWSMAISSFLVWIHAFLFAQKTDNLIDSREEILTWIMIIIVPGYLAPVFHDIFVGFQGGRESR